MLKTVVKLKYSIEVFTEQPVTNNNCIGIKACDLTQVSATVLTYNYKYSAIQDMQLPKTLLSHQMAKRKTKEWPLLASYGAEICEESAYM